ncbi:MAG: hypothetical protein E7081_03665 [Bacteroidales bacterium]|nr:hypothetical protein [Bacteroidales bacterium]
MEFDEDKAIEFIQNCLDVIISSDDILDIIDIIWDFYEDNDLLEISANIEEDDVEISKLLSYVQLMVTKNKWLNLKTDIVEKIVLAELAYEKSLDDF